MGGATGDPVERGYPHLGVVHEALTAVHRRLTADGLPHYAAAVAPADVAFDDTEDLHLGTQRVAGALVRHLRLPEARVIVTFREMTHAANVELTAGPEYFVELNTRFARHRRDIGAALAHEITHIWLHRLGLSFPGTDANEVLTDTAAAYLGAGWLLLDAFRQDALTSQKLGYLTPEEFGYVLAKRARLVGDDPAVLFTSPQAYEAYERGRARAGREERVPPLAAAPWPDRRRYARDRRHGTAAAHGAGYAFEAAGGTLRVSFPCPACRVRLRVPVRGPVRARCGVCGSVWECDT
ncbi:hypothetical protein ABZ569_08175 [Streptomyces albus]|uniref:hypothetical protein n=1 Tax=Streptomyces albus TaxID=1888 RepID=UPI0033F61E3D